MGSSGSGTLAALGGTAPGGLVDWTAQIGNLLLSKGTGYLITKWEGFGSPDVRTADMPRAQEDGDWQGRDTYGSRTLTLTITIRGTSVGDTEAKYQALLGEWYSDPTTPYNNLWFKWPDLPAYRAIGKPRRIAADKSRLLSYRIDVVAEFYSPFTPIFTENQSLTATPLIITGGGRTYPLTYPKTYTLSTSGGQSVFANNSGTYPSWALMTISGGNCSYPRVNNQGTGQFIGFDVTLTPTDTLVIDMRLRTALLNGQSVRQFLSSGASWFSLPPMATTEILFVPFSTDVTTICTVVFSPTILG